MRSELSALYQLLNTLCKAAGLDADAAGELIGRACSGIDETLDSYAAQLAEMDARCAQLADELSDARDRLNALDGQKSYR